MVRTKHLFHITSDARRQSALHRGHYVPAAYDTDGFIHCSYLEQVVRVANARYRGRSNLVLLEIEPEKVDAPIVDENLEGGSEVFPHIYGPLPSTAVVAVHELSCGKDGSFELPVALKQG